MNPVENIAEIAEFGPTVNFREAVAPDHGGSVGIVQAKDVGLGTLNVSSIVRVRELPIKGKPPLLMPNDVLLQSRGTSYRSAIVPEGIPALVAASSLYVIRAKAFRVDPRYLVLFFNLPATQVALRRIATGTLVRREELAALAVPLPPLRDQRSLVELGGLINRLYELEQRRHHLRLQELDALIKVRANIPCRLG